MYFGLRKILITILLFLSFSAKEVRAANSFNGARCLQITKRTVAFGERPSGSAAIERLRRYIVAGLKPLGGEIQMDAFRAQTPGGLIPMVDIIQRFPGTSGKAIVVTGHYDTKKIPLMKFVGANDGGSSTGMLLELARVIAPMKHKDDIYLVFFDGEEAVGEWSSTDSRYGSRQLADQWLSSGMLSKIKALINVDMIGDTSLNINNDENSSPSLRAQVQAIATGLKYGQYFRQDRTGGIDDDHVPFVSAGVNAIDLIDFDYGPSNAYWHQATDTVDKLSAHSLQVVGDVVLALVKQLDTAAK